MRLSLDTYSLRARFFPSVLVLAPVIAAVATWFPLDSGVWKSLTSVGALTAFALLLSHLARDLGKRKEVALFQLWGGPPTTRFLRHQDTTLSNATRERYLSRLAVLVPGIEIPSARSERARPVVADGVYASCADWLREKTRDREKFRLIFEENIAFGFRRNLWAMKPAGIFLSITGIIVGGSRIALDLFKATYPTMEAIVTLVISIPLLVWWLLRIRPSWVAQVADAYAQRLLAASEEL